MLKNIKLFSTDSDRTTYESSASYETPYVSKVTADNSVHYNKPIRIITFTIDGDEFQAQEGMTWNEWLNSSYNINGFIIGGRGITRLDHKDKLCYKNSYGGHYSDSDVLSSHTVYPIGYFWD